MAARSAARALAGAARVRAAAPARMPAVRLASLAARGVADVAARPTPGGAPLSALSLRSLMDYCAEGGAPGSEEASALEALPGVLPDALPQLRATLAERGVTPSAFVLWYNVLTRSTWAECAALLESQSAQEVPQFVLQRALDRVASLSDAASAVRLVERQSASFRLDVADRMWVRLTRICLERLQAWHVARRVTNGILDTAARWLERPRPMRQARAQELVQLQLRVLWAAGDDDRARRSFVQALHFARTRVPAAASWSERYAPGAAAAARRAHGSAPFFNVPLVAALLDGCQSAHRRRLLALGVRAAAAEGDVAAARTWFAELAGTHDSAPAAAWSAFLRSLALSSHDADVLHAWTLFDRVWHAEPSHTERIGDWVLMLRAAASDARIPRAQVAALLRLYEVADGAAPGGAPAEPAADRWDAPPRVRDALATSVQAHTSVIEGLLRRDDLAGAFGVWDAMVRRGVRPDSWALTSLCKLYFRARLPARALESVLVWCRSGVQLPNEPASGWLELRVPKGAVREVMDSEAGASQTGTSDARTSEPSLVKASQGPPDASSEAAAQAPTPPYTLHRVAPSTYMANTLLENLLHTSSYRTLTYVWTTLAPAIGVRGDVVSLDLMLRAACLQAQDALRGKRVGAAAGTAADTAAMLDPYAVRTYFRRVLQQQHPEVHRCTNPLDAESRSWLLRSELRLRRWERWLDERVRALFRSHAAPGVPAERGGAPPVRFDARIFHRYCELLALLVHAAQPPALSSEAWEELFLVLAWMRALDVEPLRKTLCLVSVELDASLPPGVARGAAAPLHGWLAEWLGEAALPSEAELGEYFRERQEWLYA